MNKLIVISGCSSGGKSTLLAELQQSGYSVIPVKRCVNDVIRAIYLAGRFPIDQDWVVVDVP
jgi:predicted ATPase